MNRRTSSVHRRHGGDQRHAVERLEALVSERSFERAVNHLTIVRGLLLEGEPHGPWVGAVLALRDRGVLGADEWVYFLELFTEPVISRAAEHDAELSSIREQIEAIEQEHGLGPDESWLVHEGPPEWQALEQQWNRRADYLLADYVRSLGESDLGDLIERSPEEFQGRSIDGHAAFRARWPDPRI